MTTRLLLGVIGHVDHGKTALVRALTGIDTDRLPEEKRRGISIALGFAHLTLRGAVIDVIDMPGHERFIRTMVSGATGTDAVLLVVAANERVRPQTVEHVDVAALLGIRRGVIAVSKADLVSPEAAAAAGREAETLLARAGIAAPPAVVTSALGGAGLDDLRAAIAGLLEGRQPAPDDGFPYLPVDRAFSIAGHGTVVTGTLRHGALCAGDELEVAASGLAVRVRALEVHGTRVAAAAPGQRVAVNLRGIETAAAPRGAALTARGALHPASWLTVRLDAVPDAPPLPNGARLRLLHGTEEVGARLRLLDCDELPSGGGALAQLHCATPVAVPARERFILRLVSPPRTVAGGRVIDPEATRLRRHVAPVLRRLDVLAGASPRDIVSHETKGAGMAGVPLARLARLAGVAPAQVASLLPEVPALLAQRRVAVGAEALRSVLRAVPELVAAHQAGIGRDFLARQLPEASADVLEEAVASLLARGALRQDGALLRVPRPAQDRADSARAAGVAAALAEAVRRAGLAPPDIAALAPDPERRRAVERLVREGVLVRALDRVQKREVLFHRDAVEAARRRLAPLLNGAGLLVGEVGAALGISRKYSVPLLEHLDAVHFTRRVADRRVLARGG